MLDQVTKQKIKSLNSILSGKIPDPKSRVDQITIALIYKFMNDIDHQSIEMGGLPSFFTGEFEKYNWKNILNPRLNGDDFVNLYRDGIENMVSNPNIDPLFRNIFRNANIPYRDPPTLKLFLKGIDEFEYSDSEVLGNSFEYLLSYVSSQSDAGQFRTPRHIIDFIVEIVNPKFNETVLDPACGTAGFLISAYKHILKQNTENVEGDKLTTDQKNNLMNNIYGYDISPDMIRFSLVNMYLHNFPNPRIDEYDCLSSEDKWNEYFDVILANPPFFSPEGGIQPHNRFGIKSSRAEVLFVDYIIEHLKPNGRAGIIVPEGIISRVENAYEELRKNLVKNCLVGVISLPVGVFQPYSNVKTSVLVLDKELNKRSDSIFFAQVTNDGFSLNKNRKPIKDNDLPQILLEIFSFLEQKEANLHKELKSNILKTDKCLLSSITYKKNDVFSGNSFVPLKEIATISSGNPAPQNSDAFQDGGFPFVRTSDVGKVKFGVIKKVSDHLTPDASKLLRKFKKGGILFPKSGASTLLNHRVMLGFDACVASHLAVIEVQESCINKFLLYVLSKLDTVSIVDDPSYPSLNLSKIREIKVPLPSIEIQKSIVNELEGYQKIIDGCRQVIDNFKPTIDIDTSWKTVELSEICEMVKRGITPKYTEDEGIIVVNQKCIRNHSVNLKESRKHDITNKKISDEKFVKYGDVLVNSTGVGTLGRVAQFLDKSTDKITVDSHVTIVRPKTNVFEIEFFGYMMIMIENLIMESGKGSSGQTELSRNDLLQMKVYYPKDINTQKSIIQSMKEEKVILDGNKRMVEIYTKKINDRISKVWGEKIIPK